MSSASSHSAPPPIVTRRELSLLSAARLWALASAHGLPSSGRKSALIDRLYRLRNQQSMAAAQASSHDSSSSSRLVRATTSSAATDPGQGETAHPALIAYCLSLCILHGMARVLHPRSHSASLTTRPRGTATSSPSRSLSPSAPSAIWWPGWRLGTCTYRYILVAAFPDRAPVLLAYQAIICGASSRFPPRLWLRYDQRFRASAASDSTLR